MDTPYESKNFRAKKSQPPPVNMLNFPPPSTFTTTLQTLEQQMPSVTSDFINYYVAYMQNPNNSEYHQMYSNIQSNMNNLNSQLFALSNNVESNTNTITKNLLVLDKNIQYYKYQNYNLKKKTGVLQSKNNSSNQLIHGYKELYNEAYLKNWGLGLSIVTSCFFLYVIFQNKPGALPSSTSPSPK